MNSELESLLKDTESKFNDLDRKISNNINDEQSKIDSLKKKIKKSIIGLLIIVSLSYFSVEAYKVKRKQDILFENSRYYQVMEGETLESIAEKICNDNYNINKIIAFNKRFDEDFDSIAEKGETIHFPKKYVKNSGELNNFSWEKAELNKKIQKNKNLVEITFNGNITKQRIDKIYEIIDDLDSNSEKLKILKQDNYFNNDAMLLLDQIFNLKENIKNKIDSEIEKTDIEFKLVNNIFHSDNWEKPGTIEKLENLISKNNKIRYSYDCFRQRDKIIETEISEQKIESAKEKYVNILDNIIYDIGKNKENIQEIEKNLVNIFNLGIREDDISLLNKLTKKSNTLASYELWKQEKHIQTEVNNYLNKLNKLKKSIDKKFFFAIESISNKINEFKEEKIIETTFNENLTKDKVNNIYDVLNELSQSKSKYKMLENDSYFRKNPDNVLKEIESLEKNINMGISYEIKKADSWLSKLKSELYNKNWESPGTIEELEKLDIAKQEIRNVYYCFENIERLAEVDDTGNYISSKKDAYLALLNKVEDYINKDKYKVESLQRQLDPLLRLGIQNKELPLIRELKEKASEIKYYNEWKNEKRLEEQINEYTAKINKFNFEVNNKFNYALGMISIELSKYEKEIAYGEKTGKIKGADTRLNYIVENPLAMIKYRYELLGYQKGIERANNLINKINFFIEYY
ncbi:MAG: hypothetical protein KJ968_04900 [Nanoarchaeota archaeon]|nr:hypothetical protein [Nanoarchaeota archaeon]